MLTIYKVFAGDHFIKSFVDDPISAVSLRTSLRIFFEFEHLPYEARIEREVFGDA